MKLLTTTLSLTVLSLALCQAGTTMHSGKAPAKGPVTAPPPGCPPMSYTYAEVGWFHTEVDREGDPSNDAGYIDLLYDVGNNIFLEGTATVGGGDFDLVDLSAGLGYYFPVTQCFHLTARAGLSYLDIDVDQEFGEIGFYVAPGFRLQVTCDLELYAKAFYHEYDDDDNGGWSIGGGVTYHINEQIAINTGYSHYDDGWVVQAGLRFNF